MRPKTVSALTEMRRLEVVRIAQKQGPQQALPKTGEKLRTIHSWVNRFEESGVDGLRDKSRAPKRVANKKDTDGVLAKKLVELHEKEPGLTREQLTSSKNTLGRKMTTRTEEMKSRVISHLRSLQKSPEKLK